MTLRCACGSAEVIAVKAGADDERLAEGGFVISRGRPDQHWCRACWPHLQPRGETDGIDAARP